MTGDVNADISMGSSLSIHNKSKEKTLIKAVDNRSKSKYMYIMLTKLEVCGQAVVTCCYGKEK